MRPCPHCGEIIEKNGGCENMCLVTLVVFVNNACLLTECCLLCIRYCQACKTAFKWTETHSLDRRPAVARPKGFRLRYSKPVVEPAASVTKTAAPGKTVVGTVKAKACAAAKSVLGDTIFARIATMMRESSQ